MEYNKKKMYGDRARKAEGCCKLGYPEGYYNMVVNKEDFDKMNIKREVKKDNYDKMIMEKRKKMEEHHNMNGYKMYGKKHMGPEGYWGI